MFEPDGIEIRLVDLARRLREQTEIGRAAWKRAPRRDQYIYSARKGSVVIERAGMSDVYTLRVLDPMGNEAEKFVVAPPTTGLADAALPPDAFPTLARLFAAAEQAARRGNALIDELIAEIG